MIHTSGATVVGLLREAGFAASNSDARRLILGRGVTFNGTTIKDTDATVHDDGVLRKGKSKFVRIVFSG